MREDPTSAKSASETWVERSNVSSLILCNIAKKRKKNDVVVHGQFVFNLQDSVDSMSLRIKMALSHETALRKYYKTLNKVHTLLLYYGYKFSYDW